MVNSEEKNPQNIFTPLTKLRNESEELRKIEKRDNDANANNSLNHHIWDNYGENSQTYDNDFGKLVQEDNLQEHVKAKAQRFRDDGISYCVLDLFAPLNSWLTHVQQNSNGILTIDGGVANTLDDPRRDESELKRDERKKLFCVPGDITKPEVRTNLRSIMNKLGIADDGFGTIMARPYGGANLEEGDQEYNPLYYSLLRQLWTITSNHDGEIFCPIPVTLQKTDILHNWTKLMRSHVKAGVEISPLGTNMKLIRGIASRSKLPSIREILNQ